MPSSKKSASWPSTPDSTDSLPAAPTRPSSPGVNQGKDVYFQGSRQMDNFSRRYYERELGAGIAPSPSMREHFGYTEPFRRFVQREDFSPQANPLRNQMPGWLPGADYLTNFHIGDSFTKTRSFRPAAPRTSHAPARARLQPHSLVAGASHSRLSLAHHSEPVPSQSSTSRSSPRLAGPRFDFCSRLGSVAPDQLLSGPGRRSLVFLWPYWCFRGCSSTQNLPSATSPS
jgi:hypothetical protein